MFQNSLQSIRTSVANSIVAAGGNQAEATAYAASIGTGTLLQLIVQFFTSAGGVAGLAQLIALLVSLFTASGAPSASKVVVQ